MMHDHDTIVAPATAPGGALAVVRLSGSDAIALCDRIFRGRRPLVEAEGYTVHYGRIVEGDRIVDDVLATVFRAPHSYTGEDSVELSCHGSSYILSEILRLAQSAGARMAEPGEFTVRAYLAGKMDLSQAEAVADLIASSSRGAHALASDQMRGGYSTALEQLRERLLHLASLLELELDFSEEDVEFADRRELAATMSEIGSEIDALRGSFAVGNAIKEGVPVAIVGAPNAGKSTLLNRLLHDDRALVSDIAGTTRDVIEERLDIDGVVFRFLDTAGIRPTDDRLERMGIERTLESIRRAQIIIHLVSAETMDASAIAAFGNTEHIASASAAGTAPLSDPRADALAPDFPVRPDQILLTVVNKIDTRPEIFFASAQSAGNSGAPTTCKTGNIAASTPHTPVFASTGLGETPVSSFFDISGHGSGTPDSTFFAISARDGVGVDALRRAIRSCIDTSALFHGSTIVSHSRHFQALSEARTALNRAIAGLDALPTDLLAEEIRAVIAALGTITGRDAITPDEILTDIFSKFCIGK